MPDVIRNLSYAPLMSTCDGYVSVVLPKGHFKPGAHLSGHGPSQIENLAYVERGNVRNWWLAEWQLSALKPQKTVVLAGFAQAFLTEYDRDGGA